MKNLDILISEHFFIGLSSLGKTRQGISYNISFFLPINDLKVVLREFLNPADLTKTSTFCIHKLMEIIMVNKDEDLIYVIL